MKEKKLQLLKLATLDNPKTSEYLASMARDLIKEIKGSNDNDYVVQQLDLLEQFIFRVPEQALNVIRFVISKKSAEAGRITGRLGEFEGKTHRDLLLKVIELLDNLRYVMPDDVLILIAQLSLWKEKEIRNKAIKVVEGYSKYDLRVLPKIGYSAQRKIADFVLAWSMEEKFLHLDFIEVAARELLSSSVGSSELTSVNTVTIRSGQVDPTEFLKKIRREILNLIYELFKSISDLKAKLRLVVVLDEVTQPPHNVQVNADLMEMIRQDSESLTDIYRKMISEGNPAVISHIEHRLHWMNRIEGLKTDKSEELRKEILENEFYSIFKLLVGDLTDYQEEGGWEEAERKRTEQMKALVDSIGKSNLREWAGKLNRIADQRDLVEEWRFANFEHFLIKLALTKPQLADLLFEDAFTRKLPLRYFMGGFLLGLRMKNKFELWDKYADKIIQYQNSEYVRHLVYSMILPKELDLDKAIRDKDLNILETIVNQDGPFSFLKVIKDPMLHYTLIETILRNHKRAAPKIESLIVREIDRNPQYLRQFLWQLPLSIARGFINIKELQAKTVKFLADKLTEIPDLNWQMQELLLYIGRREGCETVLDVFMRRIHINDEELKKEKRTLGERYEAIPYHLNPELQKLISQYEDYQRIMSEWIADMTPKWSMYNWNIGYFLQRIGYSFTEILMSLIEKGDDSSLNKATVAMHSIEESDLGLSIEIARRTVNEDILSMVRTNIYATGVVSGEYGLAIAYENKAKELEKYKDDSSDRVRKFVTSMIQRLNEDATREHQHADEEKQIRNIEFEG